MPARPDKREIRRSLLADMKSVSLGDRNRASRKICSTLRCLPAVKSSQIIAAFIAMKSEPDLTHLLREPPHDDGSGQFAVSRINAEGLLDFHLLNSPDELRKSDFGFLEPDPKRSPLVPLDDIDLLLVPGVGFDPSNFQRLGRGKGHYDRFLEALRTQRGADQEPATVVGVTYHQQLVSLPAEPHDQPMDALVTEEGFWLTPTG